MRDRSLRSIGPNLAKSTCGHGSRPGRPPPAAAAAAALRLRAGLHAPAITPLTKPCTSSCVMRPFGPLPFTRPSGTPSSRAKLRTDGDACGRSPLCGAVGSCGRQRRGRHGVRSPACAPTAALRRRRRSRARAAAAQPALAPARTPRAAAASSHGHQRALRHLVADLDLQLLDHARVRRRNLHRRLVAFHRDQALLDLDACRPA